jgi:hypothetical protein
MQPTNHNSNNPTFIQRRASGDHVQAGPKQGHEYISASLLFLGTSD